jgi:hypothetical protein
MYEKTFFCICFVVLRKCSLREVRGTKQRRERESRKRSALRGK